MSLALYRKYRPAAFAELKGQEHVAEPLRQALRNGRVHHAYLFSGPRGCGKTSSARILARSLNCDEGPTPDPCGTCESCVALGPSGSGHIDVIEIDAASHGGVDDARDLRERAFFAPVSARFKVYIIDEAHMVTREGFNALLKLVEEPPPHLKFIFATTEPEKVIGTIRSRTHHYPFRLLPPGTLRELLEEILNAEKVPYEPAALPLVVRAGAGSARDSLSILDQLLAGADESGITHARAVSLLGYTDSALLDEVVDAIAARDGAAVFAAVDRVIESGQDPRRFATDLLERFRDLIVLSNVPDAGTSGLLDVPPDELERMRAQAERIGPAELTRAADLMHAGLTEMRGATSPRLLLELIFARVLLPGATDDTAALLARLERLERRVALAGDAGAPASPPQAPASPSPEPAPPSAERATPSAASSGPASASSGPAPSAPAPPSPSRGPAPAAATPSPPRPAAASDVPSHPMPERPSQAPERPPQAQVPAGTPRHAAAPPVDNPVDDSGSGGASGGIDLAAVRAAWPDVLEAVKRYRRVAWMILLNDVQVASLERGTLTLAFARDGDMKGWNSSGSDAALRRALADVLGVDWRIEAVSSGGGRPTGPGASGYGAAGDAGRTGGAPNRGGGRGAAPADAGGRSWGATGRGGPAGGAPGGPGDPGPGGAGSPGHGAGSPPADDWPEPARPPASEPASGADRPGTGPASPAGPAPGPRRGPGPTSGPASGPASGAASGPASGHASGRGFGPGAPGGMGSRVPPAMPGGTSAVVDDVDDVDPEGDADADDEAAEITGMALIQRELGGEIIDEIENT